MVTEGARRIDVGHTVLIRRNARASVPCCRGGSTYSENRGWRLSANCTTHAIAGALLICRSKKFRIFQHPGVDQVQEGIWINFIDNLEVCTAENLLVVDRALSRQFDDVQM